MKKSEKQKKRINDFLKKNGSSLSSLTPKQERIVESYVHSRRSTKYGSLLIIALVIALAVVTFYGFRQLYNSTGFVNSKEVIFYAVITENDDRLLQPQQVKQITTQVVDLATVSGIRLAATVFLLAIIITALAQDRQKRKIIDAFLPKIDQQNDNQQDGDK